MKLLSGKTPSPATSSTGPITLKAKETAFIQFDIKKFYLSITEEILEKAIP